MDTVRWRSATALLLFIGFAGTAAAQLLDPAVRADAHLVAAKRAFERGDYRKANDRFEQLRKMAEEGLIVLPPDFHFFSARTLFEIDEYDRAQLAVSLYINSAGRNGRHYSAALELLVDLQEKRDELVAKAEAERKVREAQVEADRRAQEARAEAVRRAKAEEQAEQARQVERKQFKTRSAIRRLGKLARLRHWCMTEYHTTCSPKKSISEFPYPEVFKLDFDGSNELSIRAWDRSNSIIEAPIHVDISNMEIYEDQGYQMTEHEFFLKLRGRTGTATVESDVIVYEGDSYCRGDDFLYIEMYYRGNTRKDNCHRQLRSCSC